MPSDRFGLAAIGAGLMLGALARLARALARAPRPEVRPPAGPRVAPGGDAMLDAAARIGCWEAAATLVEADLRAGPLTGARLYHLGLARQMQGRFAEAEGAYRAAVAFDPADRDAAYNLAIALERQGDPAAAIIAYRDLLARRPRDRDACVNLARLYETLGMADAADGAWIAAWKAAPLDMAISSAALSASARRTSSRSFARISLRRFTASSLGLGSDTTTSG
jgi:tetratricopeptide (TPR) repeat protein